MVRLIFPTLAGLIEERLRDDPELTQVAIHAFNEWLYDDWRYGYTRRTAGTSTTSTLGKAPGASTWPSGPRRSRR